MIKDKDLKKNKPWMIVAAVTDDKVVFWNKNDSFNSSKHWELDASIYLN